MMWLFFLTLGCSLSETEFLDELVVAECTQRLSCLEPSVIRFNGWEAEGACESDARIDWSDTFYNGCTYESKLAKACLSAVEELAEGCETEGQWTVPMACERLRSACLTTDIN